MTISTRDFTSFFLFFFTSHQQDSELKNFTGRFCISASFAEKSAAVACRNLSFIKLQTLFPAVLFTIKPSWNRKHLAGRRVWLDAERGVEGWGVSVGWEGSNLWDPVMNE